LSFTCAGKWISTGAAVSMFRWSILKNVVVAEVRGLSKAVGL